MKILFVGYAKSIHLKRWARYFQAKGDKVKIISPVPEKELNIVVVTWKDLLRNNLIFYVLSRIPWVGFLFRVRVAKEFLKKEKPDILHIHNISGTYFSKDFALAGYKPTVVSVWGSDVRTISNSWSLRKVKTVAALKRVDRLTATSQFLAKQTSRLIGESKSIKVVPFGVDTLVFDPDKFKKESRENKIIIGFVKHLENIYGPEVLLEAFSIVNSKFPNSELWFIGDGSQKDNLISKSEDLDVASKVKFKGAVSHNQIPAYLSKLDIFVMPSVVEEGFGVSALEAAAMKLPVVATKLGGITEVVEDNVTGILVKENNPESLAKELLKLIKDNFLREKMGEEGRRLVEKKYDWNENASSMKKLYDELISS